MATATSYTASSIEEMMSGWQQVSSVQETQAALLATFEGILSSQQADLTQWNSITLPTLYSDMNASASALFELQNSVLPDLQISLDGNTEALANLNNVTLPALQADLNSISTNANALTLTFFSDTEPIAPDGRGFLVGDVWYDTDDGHKTYMYNGVEWSAFSVAIPDLSLTVRKFKTSTHQLY